MKSYDFSKIRKSPLVQILNLDGKIFIKSLCNDFEVQFENKDVAHFALINSGFYQGDDGNYVNISNPNSIQYLIDHDLL